MEQFIPPRGQFPHLHLPHDGVNSVPNASIMENLDVTLFVEIKFIKAVFSVLSVFSGKFGWLPPMQVSVLVCP